MDLGTGGLDIAIGREDIILPTYLDLLSGMAKTEDSLFPGEDGIYFLSTSRVVMTVYSHKHLICVLSLPASEAPSGSNVCSLVGYHAPS